jgi:predicted dehydrogenase
MQQKKKIVIIGLGSIGRRHARLLAEKPDVDIAYCDPQKEMLNIAKKEIGDFPAFSEFRAALEFEPHIMVIATPHHLHVNQTLQAIQNNIHVLCEKPLSHSYAEAKGLIDGAGDYRSVVSIGFNLHFNQGLYRLKELISNGLLGNIIHAHCRVGSYITLVNSKSRYQATMEGALLLDYAHQPDIMYWLLQKIPESVFLAAGVSGDMEFSSNPNFLAMTLEYENPLISTIHLNYLQMPERHEYEFVGDEGWAILDVNTGILRIGDKKSNKETIQQIALDRDQMYRDEHQAFFDAIDGKREPESSLADALISMKIIEAAIQSWKMKKRIKISGGL